MINQKGALTCETCGVVHIYLKRGRKPKDCPDCQAKAKAKQEKKAAIRENAVANNLTGIPILQPVTKDELVEDEVLYFVSSMFASDISKRRYASQWRVHSIDEDSVSLEKVSTKEIVKGSLSDRFHRRVGTEYVDLREEA